jgi:hypothetical protein
MSKNNEKEEIKPPHRGRIQAQGVNLEKSVNWAQDTPLTFDEGKDLITDLKKQLTKTELKIRTDAFAKLEKFVEEHGETGLCGPLLGKTGRFKVKDTQSERVELEIWAGLAFKKEESKKD